MQCIRFQWIAVKKFAVYINRISWIAGNRNPFLMSQLTASARSIQDGVRLTSNDLLSLLDRSVQEAFISFFGKVQMFDSCSEISLWLQVLLTRVGKDVCVRRWGRRKVGRPLLLVLYIPWKEK